MFLYFFICARDKFLCTPLREDGLEKIILPRQKFLRLGSFCEFNPFPLSYYLSLSLSLSRSLSACIPFSFDLRLSLYVFSHVFLLVRISDPDKKGSGTRIRTLMSWKFPIYFMTIFNKKLLPFLFLTVLSHNL